MNKAGPVEAKTGEILVMDEMLALQLEGVFLVVVPVDRENFPGPLVKGNDIGKLYPGRATVAV